MPETTSDLWEAMNTQRAIRRWKPEPVPREVIVKVIEAATKAPSGSNSQPWGFVVVTDDAKREKIAAGLRDWFAGMGDVFGDVDAIADATERRMRQGAKRLYDDFAAAPVLVIPCLVSVQSPAPEGLLAGSSIYPSIQNLQLAARAEGLGTVLTTPQRAIMDLLRGDDFEIPDNAEPVAVIPMGYADANFGPVTRKPVEEFLHWDGWNG